MLEGQTTNTDDRNGRKWNIDPDGSIRCDGWLVLHQIGEHTIVDALDDEMLQFATTLHIERQRALKRIRQSIPTDS